MPDSVRARCRLIPDFWIVAAVCLAMILLFAGVAIAHPPHDFEGWSAGAVMLVLWGATPFYWLLARARGAVIFDESGVRWRTAFGAWKSARWDEIESADVRMTATGGKTTHWKLVIRTRKREFSWTNSFENAELLAPFAARFCSRIEAKTEDWPRLFSYRAGDNLFFWLASLFLSGGFLLALFKGLSGVQWSEAMAQIEVYVGLYGWLLTLAGFALFGIMIAAVPAFFLLLFLRMAFAGWRRRGETFVATTRGLSWSVNGRERLFAAWDEQQILHIEARGPLVSLPFTRLQSARGEFNWNNGLCGGAQLSRACFERAPQLETVVQPRLREELDDAPDEQGEVLIFNFRTRSLRALLWFGPVLSLSCWGATIFGPFEPPKNGEPIPTWVSFIGAILMTAATVYGVQLFRRGCIVLDARGIAWNVPLRKNFVAWDEISGLIAERRLCLQIGARRVPLAICDLLPTRLDLLLETIAQRATNAGGAWRSANELAPEQGTEPRA